MTLRLTFLSALRGEIDKTFRDIEKPIAMAATAAVRKAGTDARDDGRKNIATAGFSRRWQTALRVRFRPKRGNEINVSARISHSIGYAGIFETGGVISGKPLLWVPLSGAPIPRSSRGRRLTPSQFVKQVGPLASVNVPGKPPLLVAKADRGRRGSSKVTIGSLRRGAAGQGNVKSVPIFVGLRTVRIPKRFSLKAIFQRIGDRIGEYYLEALRNDGRR